jgi:hypothetical protein
MGLSAFKIFLIASVVAILFLPTFMRRAQALPAAFEGLRARLSGEGPGEGPAPGPAPAVEAEAERPSLGERAGAAAARLSARIRGR